MRPFTALLVASGLVLGAQTAQAAPVKPGNWITAYSLPAFSPADTRRAGLEHDEAGRTIREMVRLNTAGSRLRVKFTNETGEAAVAIGHAHIALATPNGDPIPGSDRELHFGGWAGLTVSSGASAYSDPVDLPVAAFGDVVVSTFLPGPSPVHLGGHLAGLQVAQGDATAATIMPGAIQQTAPSFISRIDVAPAGPRRLLVAIGDSITEGAASTPGAHMSWPEQFARQLATTPTGRTWSVANAGISGNRVLHDGSGPALLARFDRDALALPGVSAVIVLEGINDVGRAATGEGGAQPVSAPELIAAFKQLIAQAHARGVRIYGGTILPYEGAKYYSAGGEAIRSTVNAWIRSSGAFDGAIDFEAVMRDPTHPTRLSHAADSGDHLHPGDEGYRLMADAIDPLMLSAGRTPHSYNLHTDKP